MLKLLLPLTLLRCHFRGWEVLEGQSHVKVRKITSESDVVSIFVVGDGGGIMEDTDLLRLNEASCSLLSEWLPGGRGLATEEMRGHWLRRHPRSKKQSSRW